MNISEKKYGTKRRYVTIETNGIDSVCVGKKGEY
jgi:hypothetical protein